MELAEGPSFSPHPEASPASGSTPARGIDEERFRALVSVTTTLVWVLSAEGTVTEVQPSLQAFTGLTWEQIEGEGWMSALHPDDRARVRTEWASFQQTRTAAVIHYRMRHRDGEYRFMRARAVPMFDERGVLREWVGANEDITESHRAHHQLREREAVLQQFADTLPHIAWRADPDGSLVWLNRRYYTYVGLPAGSALGWTWDATIYSEDREIYVAAWRRSIATEMPFVTEARVIRHDGAARWHRMIAEAVRDASGRVERWFGTATDVHDRRISERYRQSVEDRLRESEGLLRQADLRKDRFLATLAHELRNPLAPIRSGLHILRTGTSPDEARASALAMMDRQVDHMVRLIDDLMDLNRVTSDKLSLQCEPVSLQDAIQSAIETTRPALEIGRHPLQLDLPGETLVLDADLTRLSQVFSNLLNNAAKYSEDGAPIHLTLSREGDGAVVHVDDQGIGIEPEVQDRVFEMFAQVDESIGRARGGLGIGLSLARRLVEMHGGSIEVRSEGAGKGSRFTVRVPLSPSRQTTAAPDDVQQIDASIVSRRVLVVDDNRDAAESLAMLATIFGHATRTSHDGVAALREADAFRPDVVLLDIGLPGMDGYEVARALRRTDWGARARIVALTGWGQERDRQQSMDAGFDQHLVKPVDGEVLRRLLVEG